MFGGDHEPLDVGELEARKQAERDQIARELAEGKDPGQIAAEHQPYGQLGKRATMRLDEAKRLS